MNQDDTSLHFLLGANTPQGFVSRFEELGDADDGWRLFVIKGGPGSGKSVLMQKLAERLKEKEIAAELIHCSADIDSLDGVIVPSLKCAVCDGTPPHAVEPKYPGAYESIVDLSVCWDEGMLQAHREEIIALSRSVTRCHEHSCRFLAAAGSLAGDTYRIALDNLNTAKLAGYCGRLGEKEFRPGKKKAGKERVRFLSAVTAEGVVTFTDTAKRLAQRIYLIVDDHGAVSRLILQAVRREALAAGYDAISCYCPLGPFDRLEHLFVPELELGFMTSNRFHDFSAAIDPYRVVNSQRFSDREKLSGSKKRILFNRRAAAQMLRQAASLLHDAKTIHDELETYYVSATDFSKVDELTEKVMNKILP
jgi:hypothetical protein